MSFNEYVSEKPKLRALLEKEKPWACVAGVTYPTASDAADSISRAVNTDEFIFLDEASSLLKLSKRSTLVHLNRKFNSLTHVSPTGKKRLIWDRETIESYVAHLNQFSKREGDGLITVREFASLAQVDVRIIYYAITNGDVDAVERFSESRHWVKYIAKDDALAWIQKQIKK